MRQVVLLLTTHSDKHIKDKIRAMLAAKNEDADFFVLYNLPDNDSGIPTELSEYQPYIFTFTTGILYDMGYMPIGDNIITGNAHFPVLKFFLSHPDYDYYWTIENDAEYVGDWKNFLDKFENDPSDLLTTWVTSYKQDTGWSWWWSLYTNADHVDDSMRFRSFNPIYRMSNRLARAVDKKLKSGWRGHYEVAIPTIASFGHFTIKDLRDIAPDIYTTETFSHLPLKIQKTVAGMIYHPVKRKESYAPLRRNCVITAAGSESIHGKWTERGTERSFDLHVIVYDQSFSKFYNTADYMWYSRGQKLRLVYKYLKDNPQYLEHYNYFFIPDDDIQTDQAGIERLFNLMEEYGLQIAQPALERSYYTYPHTLLEHFSLLRYTNFVEMMAPCFSRDALRKVLWTFDANESGWGVEFSWPGLISSDHRDIAVVDGAPMVHTRPVNTGRVENQRELEAFLVGHNLEFEILEYGYVADNVLKGSDKELDGLHGRRKEIVEDILFVMCNMADRVNGGIITANGMYGMGNVRAFISAASRITEARLPMMDWLEADADVDYARMLEISKGIMEEEPSDNHLLFCYGWSLMDMLHGLYEGYLKQELKKEVEK